MRFHASIFILCAPLVVHAVPAGSEEIASSGPPADLVPTDAIPGNLIPKGTELKVFAEKGESGIITPTALCFDDQGALYLAESLRFGQQVLDARNHRYWLLDDLKSRSIEDRLALHEKWKDKVSLEKMRENSERIRKFADTDGDGKSDKVSIFADGFDEILDGTGAGVFELDGKVYFSCIPKLYMLEDTDGDGESDKREVIADGFGVKIWFSGHDLNGFALGNDGRIYATIADRGFNILTKEGVKYDMPNRGAVLRFEPDGTGLEVIHTGLRNPKEISFDDFGNGITVDNNSDQGDKARLVYVMDGADSGWNAGHQAMFSFHEEIGLEETPPNMWTSEKMDLTRNDLQPAFMIPPVANITSGPSGLTYYPGSGFLESQRGRFLICDYRGNQPASAIWSFKVEEEGAGMRLVDNYVFNKGVAATDVEYDYEGRLFVTDNITGWGGERSGRIYSLNAEDGGTPEVAKLMSEGFSQRSNDELSTLLGHADRRVRLRAQLALTRAKGGTKTLIAATEEGDLMRRLHAVWGLGILARKGGEVPARDTLMGLLRDPEPEIRAQAVQVLGEVDGTDVSLLARRLRDKSDRVKGFAALAVGRQKYQIATPELVGLLEVNADKDLYLRHACVMGLLGAADEEQISKLSGNESVAVRIAAIIALRRLGSPFLEIFLNDSDPKVVDEAIRAIHETPVRESRPALAKLLGEIVDGDRSHPLTPMIARRLIHSAFRQGGVEQAELLLKVAASPQFAIPERLEALRLLRQWAEPHPVDQSIGRWDPLEARDPKKILPILEEQLPDLLSSDKELVGSVLGLVETYQLGESVAPTAALEVIAKAVEYPDSARLKSLEMILSRNPESTGGLLISLASDPSQKVSTAASAELMKRDPSQAVSGLKAALESENAARRQAAWKLAADMEGDEVVELFVKALVDLQRGAGDPASSLELLEAASGRTEASVRSAYKFYASSLDATDLLSSYLPALEGGDPEIGKQVFEGHGTAQCVRCHRIADNDEAGALAGPNLAGIGANHDRHYLLESLMAPGAEIAPGFGVISLVLKNGKSLGGILQEETDDYFDITIGSDTLRVRKSDVASFDPAVSAMPPMGAMLSLREARDLVAFLSSLKTPPEHAPDKPVAKPYEP